MNIGTLMGMRKSGWIATAAAGVVLVGGGAWAATAIASDEPAAQPEIVTTPGGEPNSVPIETASPTPTVTPTPEAVSAEDEFLEAARIYPAMDGIEMSDAEILEAGYTACEYIAELGTTNFGHEIRVIPSESMARRTQFADTADAYLC